MFDCKSTSSDGPVVVNDQPPCGLQRVSDKGHRINTDISCVGQFPMPNEHSICAFTDRRDIMR